jgi:hypothetical protein
MAIILRTVKGSELTFAEVDGNFQSLFYSSSLDGTNLILHTTGSTSQSVDLSSISGGDTGSLMVTGSILNGTLTFTKGDSSTFDLVYNTGSFSGSFIGDGSGLTGLISSSYALTASYVENAQTASFVTTAQTASYVTTAQTASYVTTAQTASFVTTAQTASYVENAQTASYVTTAQTASYVTTAQTASYVTTAQTSSYVENAQTASFVTTAQTASFVTTAQTASFVSLVAGPNVTINQSGTSFEISSSGGGGSAFPFNGDALITGSLTVSGSAGKVADFTGLDSISGSIFSGSFVGDGSGLTGLVSSSYALTASYVENAQTASYVTTAQTASFVTTAQTASFVTTAQTASYVTTAQTASYVTTAQTASYVETSEYTTKWDVVNNGSAAYRFSGNGVGSSDDNPDIHLTRGEKYLLSINASGHPFEIRSSNGGSAYNDGVTNNGAQTGDVIFEVQMDAPTTLVYQCTNHSGMVGNIYIANARIASGSFSGSFEGNGSGLTGLGNVSKVGTPVNNQIGVWTGDGTIEGDSYFTWTGAQIEVTDPDNNLTEVRADWVRVYNETDDANLFLYGYGTGHRGEIVLGAANGTRGGETATLSGNTVATIAAYGHSGTGFRQGGQAVFAATENYTEGSAYGTRFILQTVADGSTTLVTRYATDGNGDHNFTGDVTISGGVTGSSFTGSFVGDGSGLTGLVSSSYALTSSYVETAQTASFVSLVAGPNVTINQAGTSFEISGSAGGGTSYWEETAGSIKLDTGETLRDVVEINTGGPNTLSGNYSQGNLLVGDGNTFGNGQMVRRAFIGGNTVVVGASETFQTSIVFGQTLTVEGTSTSVFGASHVVKGNFNFTAGQNNDLFGDNLTSIGTNNIAGKTAANINRSIVIGEDVKSYADDQIMIGFGIGNDGTWGTAKAIYVGIENSRANSGWFTDPSIAQSANFALGGRDTMRTDVGIIKAGAGAGIFYLVNYSNTNITEPTVDLASGVAMWAKDGPTGVTGLIVKDESGGKSWIGGKIGANQVTPTATIHATGEGTTSGTTGLLVEDSGNNATFKVQDDGVSIFKSFAVASLPTAVAGGFIYVSDETGGATMAFSDGTNWRRVQDRAIVS